MYQEDGRQLFNRKITQLYNAEAHKHQRAARCVCDAPICTVARYYYRSLLSVVHHVHRCSTAVFERTYAHATVGGDASTVGIERENHNCPYAPDALRFLAEVHPRNICIRQHANNTNNVTTPPSSGPHHAPVAGPFNTAKACCFIGGCGPSSVVITYLACRADMHACEVCM